MISWVWHESCLLPIEEKIDRRKKLDRRNRRNNLEYKAIEEKKIDKLDYIKVTDISAPKTELSKKRQPIEWDKVFVNHIEG